MKNSTMIADPRAVLHRERYELINHLYITIYRYDSAASMLVTKVTMNDLKDHAL